MGVPGYVDPEHGWLPTTPRDQSCAICSNRDVIWLHPLAADSIRFRVYGKTHTLPTFWTLCDSCENLYVAGKDEMLVQRMSRIHGHWFWESPQDILETIRKPPQRQRRRLGLRNQPVRRIHPSHHLAIRQLPQIRALPHAGEVGRRGTRHAHRRPVATTK